MKTVNVSVNRMNKGGTYPGHCVGPKECCESKHNYPLFSGFLTPCARCGFVIAPRANLSVAYSIIEVFQKNRFSSATDRQEGSSVQGNIGLRTEARFPTKTTIGVW